MLTSVMGQCPDYSGTLRYLMSKEKGYDSIFALPQNVALNGATVFSILIPKSLSVKLDVLETADEIAITAYIWVE